LTLGSDNGSAFTARRFRARLGELGIRHRRGGYRDPESQAFIESWFGKLKEREVWLNEYETLDDARRGIGGYVDRYHHRPHSRLGGLAVPFGSSATPSRFRPSANSRSADGRLVRARCDGTRPGKQDRSRSTRGLRCVRSG